MTKFSNDASKTYNLFEYISQSIKYFDVGVKAKALD